MSTLVEDGLRGSLPDFSETPQRATAPERRTIKSFTAADALDVGGSLVAALSLVWLAYYRLLTTDGVLGYLVCTYAVFLALFALLTAQRNNRQVRDKLIAVIVQSAAMVVLAALGLIMCFTFWRGRQALPHWNFFTQTMASTGPLAPLTDGGILHAALGTLIMIAIATALTVPLGVAAAIFLNEVKGPFARPLRMLVDAMSALPSIVAGLFILAVLIPAVLPHCGFAASLALSIMMLPIIIRASEVVLRLVPNGLREASLALGTSRWRTVWHVVLPTARSGLATAVILGMARGIGETSPVLLTSGFTAQTNLNPFQSPMVSLPLETFVFVKSSEPGYIARGFGSAAALLILVLVLFLIARLIGGRPVGGRSSRRRSTRP